MIGFSRKKSSVSIEPKTNPPEQERRLVSFSFAGTIMRGYIDGKTKGGFIKMAVKNSKGNVTYYPIYKKDIIGKNTK